MHEEKKTRIYTDIDFDRAGRQISFLRVPHSDNNTPFGFIPVPIAVIANGDGPTVLLTGGTHGDEYEGQIILRRLIHELAPESISGRLLILPALNYLAAQAGTRCWPGDNVNMNRVYPGDPDATPTSALAHYVETRLLSMCDFGMDFHSGGKVSVFQPCGYIRHGGSVKLMKKKIAASNAFAAPFTMVVKKTSDDRSLIAAADRHEVPMISCELGGVGSIGLESMKVGTRGLYNVLDHLGVLAQPRREQHITRYMEIKDHNSFVHVSHNGLFEPAVGVGDLVESGQLAGWVHGHQSAEELPREIFFGASGMVAGRRIPAQVKCGDYVFFVVSDLDILSLV